MKSPKRKRIEAAQRRQFIKKVVPYFTIALLVIVLFGLLSGCAVPKKKDAPHTYRVELGKKCVLKEDGTVAWSYVWIARDDVVLVKCK